MDYKSEYGIRKLLLEKFIFDVVSCVKPNDPILKNFFRIGYIWKVLLLCVFYGVELIHPNVQISIHSLPKDNGMVFHLQRRSNQLFSINIDFISIMVIFLFLLLLLFDTVSLNQTLFSKYQIKLIDESYLVVFF